MLINGGIAGRGAGLHDRSHSILSSGNEDKG